jgi:hypothetical protein
MKGTKRSRLTRGQASQIDDSNYVRDRLQHFKDDGVIVNLDDFPTKIGAPDVSLFLLGRGATIDDKAATRSYYLTDPKFTAIREPSTRRIVQLTYEGAALPPAVEEAFAIAHLVESGAYRMAVRTKSGYIMIPHYAVDGDWIYLDASATKRRLSSRSTDTLTMDVLNTVLTSTMTAGQVQQATISGLALASASNSLDPLPLWSQGLSKLLRSKKITLDSLDEASGLDRLPRQGASFLSVVRTSLMATASNDEVIEASWRVPLNSRATFLMNVERLPQLLPVTARNASFKTESGEPCTEKKLSECDIDEEVLCTTKKMAINQILDFAKKDPLVYVIEDADQTVYRKAGGGKSVRYVPKIVTRATVKFLRAAKEALSHESREQAKDSTTTSAVPQAAELVQNQMDIELPF